MSELHPPASALEVDHCLEQARALIAASPWCFINTLDGQGGIDARIVQPLRLDDDFTMYFLTLAGTRKAQQLLADPALTISYLAYEDQSYVSLGGRAEISDDNALKTALWQDDLATWFPEGPSAPDVIAVSCRPDWVELWSYDRGLAPPPLGLNSVRLSRAGKSWSVGDSWPQRSD